MKTNNHPDIEKQSYSVFQFTKANNLSRATFYNLAKQGLAPKTMKVGRRTLITAEAAAEWRARMEQITMGGKGHDV
jgi:predicted DNA-binding transcriptional regulator AlpA